MNKTNRAHVPFANKTGYDKHFFQCILIYTLIFIPLSIIVFYAFIKYGKSFLWTIDGREAYLPRTIYLSQTVRNGIQNLFSGKGWTIPFYDFRIFPSKTTVSSQGELLNLLAIFWPWDHLDSFYDILVIIRLYLMGVSFCLFSWRFTRKTIAICIGAFSYTFCGFSLVGGLRHPFFLAPMILLPLLLLGTEKILSKEKPWVLICAVLATLLSSVYFSVMLSVILIGYFIIRYLHLYGIKSKEDRGIIAVFFISGIISCLLSAAVVIPNLLINLDTGRAGFDAFQEQGLKQYLLYNMKYYRDLFSSFLMIPHHFNWTILGFSVLAVPCVIFLFLEHRKETVSVRLLFVIMTVMLCIPFIGYAFSGFNQVANRWCFAYAFCVCFIITIEIPQLFSASNKTLLITTALSAGYCVVNVLWAGTHSAAVRWAVVILLLSLVCIWLLRFTNPRIMLAGCLVLTCISLGYSSYRKFDEKQLAFAKDFVSKGSAYSYYDISQYASFSRSREAENKDPFYRVSGDAIQRSDSNMSFYYDVNGSTVRSSYLFSNFEKWLAELEAEDRGSVNEDLGQGSSSIPMTLSGVKYYVIRKGTHTAVPDGFEYVDTQKYGRITDLIYKNNNALPLGYTYSNTISLDEYEKLTPLQKRECCLSAVVLEDAASTSVPELKEITYTQMQLPCRVIKEDKIEWKDGVVRCRKKNGSISLSFNSPEGAEVFVRVKDFYPRAGEYELIVETDSARSRGKFYPGNNCYTNGENTQLFCLGKMKAGEHVCRIVFPAKGRFDLGQLEVWCTYADGYKECFDKLREDTLENVEFNYRGLSGNIDVSKDKILCLSIPFSKGWTARVDGEKVKIRQANTAWMGLEIPKGTHTVELRYSPPGLTAGIILSIIGVIALVVFYRKKYNNKQD